MAGQEREGEQQRKQAVGQTVTDAQKIDDWCRWYAAAPPSYKAHALFAVARNDPALLDAVIEKLQLDLRTLLLHMREDPGEIQMQTKQRRKA